MRQTNKSLHPCLLSQSTVDVQLGVGHQSEACHELESVISRISPYKLQQAEIRAECSAPESGVRVC